MTDSTTPRGQGRSLSPEEGEARAIYRDQTVRHEKNMNLLSNGVSFFVEIRGRTVELVCLSCERPARWSNRVGLFQCPECLNDLDNDQFEYLVEEARDSLSGTLSELERLRGVGWWSRWWRKMLRR